MATMEKSDRRDTMNRLSDTKIISASSRRLSPLILSLATALLAAACANNTTPPAKISGTNAPTRGVEVSTPPTVAPDKISYAFEPFTGAPGNIADELSGYLGTEARSQGLTLVRRVGAPATYRINGYLSATGDSSSITVFYVFDVVDNAGNRVHRIVGQESAPGSAGDPWSGVDADTLRRTAQRTIASLRAWAYR